MQFEIKRHEKLSRQKWNAVIEQIETNKFKIKFISIYLMILSLFVVAIIPAILSKL